MPVGEMLARMSSRELSEWMAFDRLEPVGSRRADYHAALIASTIANVHRDPKRRPYEVEDFLLFRERVRQSPEVLRQKLALALGVGHGDSR